jgi:transcriptional regulator GlxA family with amidase domain
MGRSVQEEITRVRMARAQALLRDTVSPMPEVAKACGYRSAAVLSKVFRREVGTTPTGYRQQARMGQDVPAPTVIGP